MLLDRLHHELGLGALGRRGVDGDALVHVAHDLGDGSFGRGAAMTCEEAVTMVPVER